MPYIKIDSEKPRGDEPIKYVCMYIHTCMYVHPDSRFWISVLVEPGCWIPMVSGTPDSLSCIADFKSKVFPDFGIPYIARSVIVQC